MKFYAFSQMGTGKSQNDDRIVIGKSIITDGSLTTDIKSGIVAVADGVGGNNAGAVASHFVTTELSRNNEISVDVMTKINNDLLMQSASSPEWCNMATTLSGLKFEDGKSTVFSIGNTRVYLLQNGKYLKQITNDDTTMNYLINSGQLSPDDIESFDRKSEIIACFGGGNPELFKIKISAIDISCPVLITSDGIHDYLSEDEIEDIIDEYGVSLITCEALVAAARKNSSTDDASVVIGGAL